MKLEIDNIFAINLVKRPIAHGKSKHIEPWFHFLRDQVNKGRLKLDYCKVKEQDVDVLTKPLKKEKFEKLKNKECGHQPYAL